MEASFTPTRALILSDSHGFHGAFSEVLRAAELTCGEDGRWVIPNDLQVIHLGDTVDRGPDSPDVFNAMRQMQQDHPSGQVVRLLGNHEFHYCGGPVFYQTTADEAAVTPLADAMREDGKSGALSFAYALTAGNKEWLCVHGGFDPRHEGFENYTTSMLADRLNDLGREFFQGFDTRWRMQIGLDADQRAEMERKEREFSVLTGVSRARGGYDHLSGVTWCDIHAELVPQEDNPACFPQIVGHRANDEVFFSSGGKLIGVNVHYGTAQGLLVDLQTGEMTTTKVFEEPDN